MIRNTCPLYRKKRVYHTHTIHFNTILCIRVNDIDGDPSLACMCSNIFSGDVSMSAKTIRIMYWCTILSCTVIMYVRTEYR